MSKTKKAKKKVDVYEIINNTIIESLEAGVIPWQKSWKVGESFPMNLVSKKHYNGINIMILSLKTSVNNYLSPYWLTFNQCKKLKGSVKSGEKSTKIIFWTFINIKRTDRKTGETEDDRIPLLRYYNVFNTDQCVLPEGSIPVVKVPDKIKTNDILKNCEKIIKNYKGKPDLEVGKPSYSPILDNIYMPKLEDFKNSESYYSVYFHEITHSTGHKNRLNREGVGHNNRSFGSESYSKEELVAEVGASYLSFEANIQERTINNSVGYIANWLQVLKDNKKWLVCAFGKAQKAVDLVLNKKKVIDLKHTA